MENKKQKFKFAIGTTFDVEAETFEEACKIAEEKDCNDHEKAILEVNTGIYMFDYTTLNKYIFEIKNNNKQLEYYLPDLVRICILNDIYINRYVIPMHKQYQIKGVNTQSELEEAKKSLKYYA